MADRDAEYAVVAEAGDHGPPTVVTLNVAGARLVVGGGTTFLPRVREDALSPTGEQAGCAVQYALASMAAQQTQTEAQRRPDGRGGRRAGPERRAAEVGPI
ncbi:hypothetical protein PWY87_04955 [Kribbella solani]|uniref:hypothetical protein n=1 Tax=Kribbella solani TaxID=236067 RepID=UPI0029BAA433|nr:hypothetical protein [Kribbella solani]MDX3001008.1 hypothetical protein [Kribbella solani]